jgi:hypothetical protein
MEHSLKIKIKNLDFYYGNFKALHDISMDIYANQVTAINADLKVPTFSRFRNDHSWPVKLATA